MTLRSFESRTLRLGCWSGEASSPVDGGQQFVPAHAPIPVEHQVGEQQPALRAR